MLSLKKILLQYKTRDWVFARYPGWHPFLLPGIFDFIKWKLDRLRRRLAVFILPSEYIIASRIKVEVVCKWNKGEAPVIIERMWV